LAEQTNAAAGAPPGRSLPLAVDLDGTLLATDTLFEAIVDHLRRRPLGTVADLVGPPFGLARMKARLQKTSQVDPFELPVNEAVLDYCREAQAQGREVWIVSAADDAAVSAQQDRFPGVFTGAIGSDGQLNNKGPAKARRLREMFPDGFEYIGDSPADYPVWRAAALASHVGGGAHRTARIEAGGTRVAHAFPRPGKGLADWARAMRLHQWLKNLLIFAVPALSLQLQDPQVLLSSLVAFVLMGVLASGTYILNDLFDLSADRRHPTKRSRPFASGDIKLWRGCMTAPLMILSALLGAFMVSPALCGLMGLYLAVTLAYSMGLKQAPLLDVFIIASLFTLRLYIGAVIAGAPVSDWLLVFSLFLFLSLALAKRHVELVKTASAAGGATVRGYVTEDRPLTLGLGLATAAASPLILSLYVVGEAWPSGLYSAPSALWILPAATALWLMRIWLFANRGVLHDDPVVFAARDPVSLALGGLMGVALAGAVFAGS